MICPSCSEKNRDGARFCEICGTELERRCPVCDSEVSSRAMFCDSCGSSLSELEQTTAAPAAARKVVTVLFADLTGSTALEEKMDAESVRTVLDRFYAAMRTEVERHSGRVVKFTGDGVMAAFGVPDVHEDDALRAIDAALAMRSELEELASDLELDLSLKIGINTGEVVVAGPEDDVVGDSVNVASRLEGAAESGEILVGEETWRLTRATSRYEPVPPLTLKGKSEPVPAYRLLAVDERTADSAAAPFVGREDELAKLIAAFDEAVATNSGRLVTIVGSPGLGKTRLARELGVRLGDRARVRETRCDPAGTSTFEPVAEVLRAAAGITETHTEEQVVAALEARMPENDRDRTQVARRAAAILGVGYAGTTEETFWAIRRLIEAAAAAQPRVLIFDDLQWAEPLLLDLVEHLAEWIQGAPVLVIGTGRPELREIRPSLVEGGRATAVVALEGLDQAATAQLAMNLLEADDLPVELLAKIPASTEGNPLFVRELVRMLVDDGVIVRTADGWSVTVDVDAIQVPPTIQSLLSARVERLRSDERTIVEIAAVIGKEFYRGALRELAPPGVRNLVDGILESLRRKELVEPVGTYWIDEPVYRFHHVLIRDAAYRRVLKESRAEVHVRVADWLEHRTEEALGDYDEIIGFHLEQAADYKRQLGRPDEALGEKAAALLGNAAQRALDRDDLPAAASLSGRALASLPLGDPKRPELLLVRCEALLSMGDASKGAAAVAEFDDLAHTPRLRAWSTCFNGQVANLTAPEQLLETERTVAAAASELIELGDEAGAAKAYTVQAAALAALCRFGECEAVLDRALNSARQANDRRRITAALGAAPHNHVWGPNVVARAGGRCLDIVRLLRITTGSPAVEATSRRCQAVLEAFRGRFDAARGMLRSARRVYSELGLEHELLEAEQFAGIVELIAGDAAAAEEKLRAAHDGFRRFGADLLAAQAAAYLARAYLVLGEDDEAEAVLGPSERVGTEDLKTAIGWRSAKAELLAKRGRHDEAFRLANEAVELGAQTDALFDRGNACRSLATVLSAAGDAAGARRAEGEARALFERKGATALVDAGAEPVVVEPEVASPSAWGPEPNRAARVFPGGNVSALTPADVISRFAPDAVWEDRRVGFGMRFEGADAVTDNLLAIRDLGASFADMTVVATRGDNLALLRIVLHGGQDAVFEVEVLTLFETNDKGLGVAALIYGEGDLPRAMAELDDRFLVGKDADTVRAVKAARAICDAYSSHDASKLRALFTDDVTTIDHRPLSFANDADAFVEAMSVWPDLASGIFTYISALPRMSGDRALASAVTTGTTHDGGQIEIGFHAVAELAGHKISHIELFASDELEAAIACYDERSRAAEPLTNAATHAGQRLIEGTTRGDRSALNALFAEEVVGADRRLGLTIDGGGHDAAVEGFMSATYFGAIRRHDMSIVATRGDSLAVGVWTLGDDDSYQVEGLAVIEVNETGQISFIELFDPSDFLKALETLDERFASGEGADAADAIRIGSRAVRALSTRDWDDIARVLSPDLTVLDHRPVSLGSMTRDEYVASLEVLLAALTEARAWFPTIRSWTPTALHTQLAYAGTTMDGAAVEATAEMLGTFSGQQVVRVEMFPPDQLTEASDRFQELTRAIKPLENAAVRAERTFHTLLEQGNLEAIVELFAADAGGEDRRLGMQMKYGRREGLESFRFTSGVVLTSEELAIRGDRLALLRSVAVDSAAREIPFLVVNETDAHQKIRAIVVFDPTDISAALAELDERFAAGEGSGAQDVVRLGSEILRLASARDWTALRSKLADDLVVVDHRPASLGQLDGVDAWVESLEVLTSLVTDYETWIQTFHRLTPTSGVLQSVAVGHTADGATYEIATQIVATIDSGRVNRIEAFGVDQLSEALARFEELTRPPAVLENTATRLLDAARQLYASEDWEAFGRLYADEFAWDDRRAGMRSEIHGRDQQMANIREIEALGVRAATFTPVAIRGDRLALVRSLFSAGAETFETEALIIIEANTDGRAVANVLFDADDLGAAMAELDERFMSGEGIAAADQLRAANRLMNASKVGDAEAMLAEVADDLVFVDHRPMGAATTSDAATYVDAMLAFGSLLPDARATGNVVIVSLPALSPTAAVAETLIFGGPPDARYEIDSVVVTVFENGRFTRMEVYPTDRLDEALARYAELTRPPVVLENLAIRLLSQAQEAYASRDWDAVERINADDFVWDDRRTGLRSEVRGGAAQIANLKEIAAIGVRDIALTPLAIRGDRLALGRVTVSGGTDTFETEALGIVEATLDGRVAMNILFDPDDLGAAMTELDERFASGEGSAAADHLRSVSRMIRALNSLDRDAMLRELAEDLITVDHRLVVGGAASGAEEFVDSVMAFFPLGSDASWTHSTAIVAFHALSAAGGVGQVLSVGGLPDALNEIETQAVSLFNGTRISRLDFYAPEQLAEALARYEELTAQASEHPLIRAVRESMDRLAAQDWDAYEAMIPDDVVWDDRRIGMTSIVRGKSAMMENARAIAEVGARFGSVTEIDNRGDRLALGRMVVRAAPMGSRRKCCS